MAVAGRVLGEGEVTDGVEMHTIVVSCDTRGYYNVGARIVTFGTRASAARYGGRRVAGRIRGMPSRG